MFGTIFFLLVGVSVIYIVCEHIFTWGANIYLDEKGKREQEQDINNDNFKKK